MASFPLVLKLKTVANKLLFNNSLPYSRSSHPLIPQFNEDFCSVKIGESLNGLEDLYNCVNDHFLLLPQTPLHAQRKWADGALDGSLGLLDVCATTMDVLAQSRLDLQQLQSILRRRRDSNDFEGYLSLRSEAKKVALKSLKDLKLIKLKQALVEVDCDQEKATIVIMLKEAEADTLAVLEALLSYLVGTTKPKNWSLVVKLMHKKRKGRRISNEFEKVIGKARRSSNEYEKVKGKARRGSLDFERVLGKARRGSNDFEKVIKGKVRRTSLDFERVKGEIPSLIGFDDVEDQLRNMDASIKCLEEALDSMFKRLLKVQVSLLKIVNS